MSAAGPPGSSGFPPNGPTTLQDVIRSYVYAQYSDDDASQTFIAAYNVLAQRWINWFTTLNLPVYSGLTGQLLDWVGQGLYGIWRPLLSYQQAGIGEAGPYNTIEYNALEYNGVSLPPVSAADYIRVNDDQYRRIITWHTYKGDGFQYSTRWLKRRVHRFLNGSDGTSPSDDRTDDVSVTYSGTDVTIAVYDQPIGKVLQYAIGDGVLALPFQYNFTVSLTLPQRAGGYAAGMGHAVATAIVIAANSGTAAGAGSAVATTIQTAVVSGVAAGTGSATATAAQTVAGAGSAAGVGTASATAAAP